MINQELLDISTGIIDKQTSVAAVDKEVNEGLLNAYDCNKKLMNTRLTTLENQMTSLATEINTVTANVTTLNVSGDTVLKGNLAVGCSVDLNSDLTVIGCTCLNDASINRLNDAIIKAPKLSSIPTQTAPATTILTLGSDGCLCQASSVSTASLSCSLCAFASSFCNVGIYPTGICVNFPKFCLCVNGCCPLCMCYNICELCKLACCNTTQTIWDVQEVRTLQTERTYVDCTFRTCFCFKYADSSPGSEVYCFHKGYNRFCIDGNFFNSHECIDQVAYYDCDRDECDVYRRKLFCSRSCQDCSSFWIDSSEQGNYYAMFDPFCFFGGSEDSNFCYILPDYLINEVCLECRYCFSNRLNVNSLGINLNGRVRLIDFNSRCCVQNAYTLALYLYCNKLIDGIRYYDLIYGRSTYFNIPMFGIFWGEVEEAPSMYCCTVVSSIALRTNCQALSSRDSFYYPALSICSISGRTFDFKFCWGSNLFDNVYNCKKKFQLMGLAFSNTL